MSKTKGKVANAVMDMITDSQYQFAVLNHSHYPTHVRIDELDVDIYPSTCRVWKYKTEPRGSVYSLKQIAELLGTDSSVSGDDSLPLPRKDPEVEALKSQVAELENKVTELRKIRDRQLGKIKWLNNELNNLKLKYGE